jgi:hypothetical protein
MKFILLIILFLFLIGAFFGFSVFRFLLGGRPAPKQDRQKKQNQSSPKSKQTKKIIKRDEGEYVDFEEIKDQNSKS